MELKPIKPPKDTRPFFEKLKVTWYFDTFMGKLIIVLGLVALIYSIFRIFFKGFW